MKNRISDITMGFCFGILFLTVLNALPWTHVSQARAALSMCEKDLPRSQECRITAEPIEDNTHD